MPREGKQFISGSRTPQDNKAIREKAQEMMGNGYPPEQAIAIAFRMFGDGELSPSVVPVLTGEEESYNNSLRQQRITSQNSFEQARRAAVERYKRLIRIKRIRDNRK